MCPHCGAVRGRVTENDETEDGLPLRERLCAVCSQRYATVEVPVPDATISQLGTKKRDRNRYAARERRGYHGMQWGTYRRPWARLRVRVKVIWSRE